MRFILLFIFTLPTLGSFGQETLKLKMPKPGDSTVYAKVKWDEKEIFTSFDYIQWEYKKFRPQLIKKERFTEVKNAYTFTKKPSVALNKGNGDIYYYAKEDNNVILVGISEKSDITKNQVLHYNIVGSAEQYPLEAKLGDQISNAYDKVATVAKSDLSEFVGLPLTCDSIKIIIKIEEEFTFYDVNILEMHHFDSPAILKEGDTRKTLSMKIKFENNDSWYPYTYTRKDLPYSLMYLLTNIVSKKYVYYTGDFVFPVLQYSKTNRKIHDISFQDDSNIFNAETIDAIGRFIYTDPKPTYGVTTFTLINSSVGPQRLEIFNAIGKRVRIFNFKTDPTNEFKADLSSLPKGIYLYRFIDYRGRRSNTHRLVKMTH